MADRTMVKQRGAIYTPAFLVNVILDFGGYTGKKILHRHVMDNSCGDGAFLTEIVRRYCRALGKRHPEEIKRELETYIHGIEIDADECEKTRRNLDSVAREVGVTGIKWDIRCADALSCFEDYRSRMDFVFGNPPYVRVHNLAEKHDAVKKFSFSRNGMTDLYIVFFEIGFDMLSEHGTMAMITPSSWLNSVSGSVLRNYIREHDNLTGFIDLEHFQAFDAMTYTIVSRFEKTDRSRKISYSILTDASEPPVFKDNLSLKDMDMDGCFYLSRLDGLRKLRNILETQRSLDIQVKNGFATLADKLFIAPVDCENGIDVIKASTGKWSRCVFPYDRKGKPIPFENLGMKTKKYLLDNKEKISKHGDADWYLFGRSQGVNDVFKNKIAVNSIVKDVDSIKLNRVSVGEGVYSGLYILCNFSFAEIQEVLCCDDFIQYVKMLKKYKSGGYYTFSSKDLKKYLTFKLGEKNGQP